MKKKILALAKKLGKLIIIESNRLDFDMIQYIIRIGNKEDSFVYYTGKTSSGIDYPTENDKMLKSIENFIATS